SPEEVFGEIEATTSGDPEVVGEELDAAKEEFNEKKQEAIRKEIRENPEEKTIDELINIPGISPEERNFRKTVVGDIIQEQKDEADKLPISERYDGRQLIFEQESANLESKEFTVDDQPFTGKEYIKKLLHDALIEAGLSPVEASEHAELIM